MPTRSIRAFPHHSLLQTRAKTALALKARGNKLYSAKQYEEAIAYYTKAIECEEQAVFYSNRAACESRTLIVASALQLKHPAHKQATPT